jgi:hypothetical protein
MHFYSCRLTAASTPVTCVTHQSHRAGLLGTGRRPSSEPWGPSANVQQATRTLVVCPPRRSSSTAAFINHFLMMRMTSRQCSLSPHQNCTWDGVHQIVIRALSGICYLDNNLRIWSIFSFVKIVNSVSAHRPR